jgi:hypothetical protein
MIAEIKLEITITNAYDDNVIKFWSNSSGLHRTDGPAVIYPNNTRYWYENGIYKPKSEEAEGF